MGFCTSFWRQPTADASSENKNPLAERQISIPPKSMAKTCGYMHGNEAQEGPFGVTVRKHYHKEQKRDLRITRPISWVEI